MAVADVNGDGWPDIYVSNDGLPNDALYVNNRDGTFTNRAAQSLRHTSAAGMGVDVADFNNDGWPDIIQVDMQPRDLARRKRMSGIMSYGNLLDSRQRGFREDYTLNALQLSNGVTPAGDVVFSDIGRMAGVSHTDWSWAPLFADFDNDGYKDIFIGNGYPKAVNDLDYVNAISVAHRRGGQEAARREHEILAQLPGYDEPNYLFRNAGDLTFVDVSKAWGLDQKSYSYGAAYVDLDNDGRLDLVVNNIDGAAFVYRNVQPNDDAHHFLRVRLEGQAPNLRGIGTTLVLSAGNQKQYLYQSPYRGYMSSMDDRPHFGLGQATIVDTLEVRWPDGRSQRLTHVAADREIVVRQADASARHPVYPPAPAWHPFVPVDSQRSLAYRQRTPDALDISVQSLLPYMLSSHGPPLAVGDVDGDGLDDVFIGGAGGVPGKLFLQQRNGSFVESTAGQPWEADKSYEDWGAVFFDANGDGRPDLYVASGGYTLAPTSPLLQDRLYLNRGGGHFVRAPDALPPMLTSKAAVRVADFNGDGRPDLFVGGRLTPRDYPAPTRSYLLRNDGDHFTDVTEQLAPALAQPGGMITDAQWVDYDADGRVDLVTVGEWMSIRFYHNEGGRFRDATSDMHLPPMRGWWYSLAVGDFDHDGRPDLVAGNLGLNYSYTTSKDSTFGVYAGDFTGSRKTDLVFTTTVNGTEYPIAGYSPLGQDIYTLGIRFPTYGAFSTASIQQLFTPAQLRSALHYEADTFASMYLHNEGNGRFTASALPNAAQIAPIKAILPIDVDGDGQLDVVVAGNLYDAEPNTPRADAGNGLWLRGDGKGHFTAISPRESGFLAPLNVSGLALVRTAAGAVVLVANTGDTLQTFAIRKR